MFMQVEQYQRLVDALVELKANLLPDDVTRDQIAKVLESVGQIQPLPIIEPRPRPIEATEPPDEEFVEAFLVRTEHDPAYMTPRQRLDFEQNKRRLEAEIADLYAEGEGSEPPANNSRG